MKCDSVSASNESDGGKSIPLSNTCFSTYTDFTLDCSKNIDPEFVFNKIEIDENYSADEIKIHQFLDSLNINQVNIKETEEARKSGINSPSVRKAFDERRDSLFGTNRT